MLFSVDSDSFFGHLDPFFQGIYDFFIIDALTKSSKIVKTLFDHVTHSLASRCHA